MPEDEAAEAVARPQPEHDPWAWWRRASPVGRIAVAVAVGMGAITLVAVLLSPWLGPRWEAYLGARLEADPDGAVALQRVVQTAILVWLAAVLAAGATLLVDWWLDRPKA